MLLQKEIPKIIELESDYENEVRILKGLSVPGETGWFFCGHSGMSCFDRCIYAKVSKNFMGRCCC